MKKEVSAKICEVFGHKRFHCLSFKMLILLHCNVIKKVGLHVQALMH